MATATARIVIENRVRDGLLDDAWKLYQEAFEQLNALTVQRHLMTRSEFEEVCWDIRVQKWLVLDDSGALCGLATYTNVLESMPLISPAYFERRWPQLYALSRIWYCGFVAVAKFAPRATFTQLITGMYRVAEVDGGVIGLDVCRYNDETLRLGRVIKVSLARVSGGKVLAEVADEQRFMIYQTNPAKLGPG